MFQAKSVRGLGSGQKPAELEAVHVPSFLPQYAYYYLFKSSNPLSLDPLSNTQL